VTSCSLHLLLLLHIVWHLLGLEIILKEFIYLLKSFIYQHVFNPFLPFIMYLCMMVTTDGEGVIYIEG
jgi:hypothetical protein